MTKEQIIVSCILMSVLLILWFIGPRFVKWLDDKEYK
jgi:hypothetical protein